MWSCAVIVATDWWNLASLITTLVSNVKLTELGKNPLTNLLTERHRRGLVLGSSPFVTYCCDYLTPFGQPTDRTCSVHFFHEVDGPKNESIDKPAD